MARIQTTTNDQSIVPIRSEHHYGARLTIFKEISSGFNIY